MEPDRIVITGARQHNLRNVTVEIPKKKLVVLTGRLGLRQVLARLRHPLRRGPAPLHREPLRLRPAVPRADGEAPLRLDQGPRPHDLDRAEDGELEPALHGRHRHRDPRLPARAVGPGGPAHLPPLRAAGLAAVGAADRPRGPAAPGGDEVPRPRPAREGEEGRAPGRASSRSASPASPASRVDGIVLSLEDEIRLDKKKKHSIDAVVDRLVAKPGLAQRLTDSVETALKLRAGHGDRRRRGAAGPWSSPSTAPATTAGSPSPSRRRSCSPSTRPRACARSAPASARAWRWTPTLVVPNPDLSVNEGAVKPLGAVGEATTWGSDIVRAVARERGIDLNKPWKALSEEHRRVILFGTGGERVEHQDQQLLGHGLLQDALRGRHQLDDAADAGDEVGGHAAVLPEVPLLAARARRARAGASAPRPSA